MNNMIQKFLHYRHAIPCYASNYYDQFCIVLF